MLFCAMFCLGSGFGEDRLAGLDWIGLGWIGLDWIVTCCVRLGLFSLG